MTPARIGLLALAALLVAGALAASAAVTGGRWKGKTEQNSTLNMTVKNGKVTRFSANTRMFCTNGEGFRYRVLYHDRPVAIRDGKFKFAGETKDGADYEFKGRFTGAKKANGTLGFHEGSYNASNGSFTFCNASDVKWQAKPQG